MERIKSINPERIAWCCDDYGITQSELAVKTGIAITSIEKVMSSKDGLTFNQLSKIANYFNRGVLFFIENGPVDETQVHTPQFRTLANQKPQLSTKLKTLIERVEKQREVYVSLREDLDDDRPWFKPPDLSNMDPQNAARIAREWLGLDGRNSFQTYRSAVEKQGVLVFQSNGYSGKWQISKESLLLGLTIYDPVCPVIVLKKQISKARQSFTLMHELGHLLMHKNSSIDDEYDLQSHRGWEQEANAFAGYLLVPDNFLLDINDNKRPDEVSQYDDWLASQRNAWGVSGEVILRRLLQSNRLHSYQYHAYREWRDQLSDIPKDGGSRIYRYREPKHIFGDIYVRTVLDALSARHITLTKASTYLDSLKINDLHQLERYYARF